MAEETGRRTVLTDGHKPRPANSGPVKVQGGYKPTTSQHGAPPSGGSAVRPKP
jgi:hypothetical protein